MKQVVIKKGAALVFTKPSRINFEIFGKSIFALIRRNPETLNHAFQKD